MGGALHLLCRAVPRLIWRLFPSSQGPALSIGYGTAADIYSTLFADNRTPGDGAAVYLIYASALLSQCVFANNRESVGLVVVIECINSYPWLFVLWLVTER